ncbi:MAG: cytochrome P450 [Allosphingosinicella sp.]|uniref:cytochrome P450 n=1 Tax=Allosphingosinicella sp. TaxID=2823234 RepID=UPI00393DF97B
MTAPARPRYVPPHPPRGPGPVPVWRGFFGERARTSVYGWSRQAFVQDHIRRNVLGWTVHVPLDPAAVQHVLLDNAANYAKPEPVKAILAPVIGRGLLTADGALWRDQRRIVAANFVPAAVEALVPSFARAAEAAAAAWPASGVVDMARAATETTLTVIADALFGGDPRLRTAEGMRHIEAALAGVSEARLPALLGLPVIGWNARIRAGQRGQAYLRETLSAVVRDRLPDGGGDDFLGRLVRMLRERFAPDEAFALAVDNAATFYLAGHETTANALSWALFLLAEQPDLQAEAAAEARAALAAGTDDPALPDRLPLLRAVIDETLRLYPPAPRFDRQALGPDRLGGREVAKGDIVSIWPWILHRHSALWDDPDAFDAHRFLPGAAAAERHRFQYLPFGAGPRVCVGARFAIVEALVILATWLARHHFSPLPGREVQVSGMVTLRPKGGLPLRVRNRENC